MDTNTNDYIKAESDLVFWNNDKAGGFTQSLFNLIAKSDAGNRYRLSLGFPEHVDVYDRYQNEEGYYEMLLERHH